MSEAAIGTTLPPGPDRCQALDEVSEAYDRYRPGYPADLADDVEFLAGLPPGGRILEIGCGTGQLTRSFSRRGYSIVALEPGPRLAERTRQNFAASGDVQVIGSTLEAWEPGAERFDLVMSGQSFHFLEPAGRFGRVADVLNDTGALAVVWNYRMPGDTVAYHAVHAAIKRHAPGFGLDQRHLDTLFEDEVEASGHFGSVYMRKYRWTHAYNTEGFAGLLISHGTLSALPEVQRAAVFQAARDALDGAGGQLTIEYLTRLYVARKRPRAAA